MKASIDIKMQPILKILLGVVVFCAIAIVFGIIVMLLWNMVIPDVFGFTTINYWQALGLIVLARVLFGGFNAQYCGGNPRGSKRGHQINAMREKWQNMSETERKEFMQSHPGNDFFNRMWDEDTSSHPKETTD